MTDVRVLKPVRQPASNSSLRGLPQVHKLLDTEDAAALQATFRRDRVAEAVRDELASLRDAALAGAAIEADLVHPRFFARVAARLQEQHRRQLRRVVNATGVVLHTNLGRAPLAPQAVQAVVDTAEGYCNLEYDLERGARGSRQDHLEALLCRLTGAEAGLVVNNCAAAVLLTLAALARGGEVVVSRGELIEIGGAFRLPDVIAQSGARLVEVGTTNKTRVADYERAIGPETRLILRSHPSNYRIVGFTEQPARAELAALARARGLPLLEDLGSGTLVDLRPLGVPPDPTVQACVREGGGLVAFSGDKLLGGPQAGVVVGPTTLVQQLRQHPLQRALRPDKLSLAALEATLRLYEGPEPPQAHIPTLRMLAQTHADLQRRARALARRLRRALPALACTVQAGESVAGGGSLPESTLPTALVLLVAPGLGADALARRLRAASPAVIGRVVAGAFALDLRTLADDEIGSVIAAMSQVLRSGEA